MSPSLTAWVSLACVLQPIIRSMEIILMCPWFVFGTGLSVVAESVYQSWSKPLVPSDCVLRSTNKEEGLYTIAGFTSNQAIYEQTMNCQGLCSSLKYKLSALVMIPLLERPSLSSFFPPCLFKPGVEQTGLFSRDGHPAVDYALPPLVFIHHLPLTPAPSLIICPILNPWCRWSSASWSTLGIISSLLS